MIKICTILGRTYQALWGKLCHNFESIGIGTYEVYYGRNPGLFHEIGANKYPQFIAVVNGRAIKYKGDMNQRGVRDFISTILPHHLINHVSCYLLNDLSMF